MTADAPLPAPRPLRSVTYGFPLALSSPVVLALAPALYRLGVGGLSVLLLIPVAILLAVVALVLSLVGLVATRRRGAPRGRAVAGLVVALAVLAFPAVVVVNGRGTAPIHDVTTDTDNPPQFVDVLPVRERTKALNPVAYEGARVADLQKRSYPDIQSLHLDVAPRQAFTLAQAAVQAMHWDLVAATLEAGRLEATDTTALFGFKDDVVVRVRAEGSGSRIDVRSLSRVGGGDLGANANRIRLYLQRLSGKGDSRAPPSSRSPANRDNHRPIDVRRLPRSRDDLQPPLGVLVLTEHSDHSYADGVAAGFVSEEAGVDGGVVRNDRDVPAWLVLGRPHAGGLSQTDRGRSFDASQQR